MRFKTLSTALVSILVLIPSILQAQFTLEGEFRPRTEYRNGYRQLRTSATEPAFFTSQRTRLSLNYETPNYELHLEGQDVRVWGDVQQLQDTPNLNIHEAWAQIDVSDKVQLKAGRQELIYGNQRLLGSVNWTQQARSHEALVAKYATNTLEIDVGAAYNQQSESLLGNTYQLNNYKVLSYAWLDKQFGALHASALVLMDGFESQSDNTRFRYTYGTNLTYSEEPWTLSGSVYLQRGDDRSRRNISAHMFTAEGTYSWSALSMKGGFNYLSGGEISDDNPEGHTFSTLYATNHKFYGNMDYFLNIPSDTGGGGLQDLFIGADYTFSDSADLSVVYHYFALANEIRNPLNTTEELGISLGTEIDLSFSYRFTKDIAFRAGYSIMLPTSSLRKVQGRNGMESQHWGWAMLQITPRMFNAD